MINKTRLWESVSWNKNHSTLLNEIQKICRQISKKKNQQRMLNMFKNVLWKFYCLRSTTLLSEPQRFIHYKFTFSSLCQLWFSAGRDLRLQLYQVDLSSRQFGWIFPIKFVPSTEPSLLVADSLVEFSLSNLSIVQNQLVVDSLFGFCQSNLSLVQNLLMEDSLVGFSLLNLSVIQLLIADRLVRFFLSNQRLLALSGPLSSEIIACICLEIIF